MGPGQAPATHAWADAVGGAAQKIERPTRRGRRSERGEADAVGVAAQKKGICEHQRRSSRCKECGGASISEHTRIMRKCKEC